MDFIYRKTHAQMGSRFEIFNYYQKNYKYILNFRRLEKWKKIMKFMTASKLKL